MITVDQPTWDRWNETGEWVLFREGVWHHAGCETDDTNHVHPPAEFVEWAKPCETCRGHGLDLSPESIMRTFSKRMDGAPAGSVGVEKCKNPDCLDGKRRITVKVPCERCHPFNGDPADDGRCQTCGIKYHCVRCGHPCNLMATGHGPDLCEPHDGLVTVGHVVVAWGPWRVVESWVGARANPHKVACLSHNGFLDWRWSSDDLTLVGQYALGGKVVEP